MYHPIIVILIVHDGSFSFSDSFDLGLFPSQNPGGVV
jgi:hypothetical protein